MLAASVATATILLYALAGHGLHDLTADDGVSSAAAGLCLLLVTVVVYVAVVRPEVFRQAVVAVGPPTHLAPPEPLRADRRARASPVALQRFRN